MRHARLLALGIGIAIGGLLAPAVSAAADDAPLRQRALEGLRRATDYFRKEVSTEGGYLWRYRADLSKREGERPATATMVWVQPPGTPSVGLAYLDLFRATGDPTYRDAARDAARALVRGQLRSGGWDYHIEFDPALRPRYAYRVDSGPPGKQNVTTLDDNTTQEALRLLMRVDRVLEFADPAIHEAAVYALAHLLEAQYPNGAWPQRFDRPPAPKQFPVEKASYPESWSRTFPGADYRGFYTLNDNAMGDMIDVMLEAARVYGETRYRASAERGGDFLLLAQMPEPQPAWAQQYNAAMQPAWARKFEPPSITGGESQSALRTLLTLYGETGQAKYLEAVPSALAYLRRSRLPEGGLARFYELRTNRPLYFTKAYQLTYSDADMPTHYSFKVRDGLDAIARRYDALKAGQRDSVEANGAGGGGGVPRRPSPEQVEAVLKALDAQGRWVEEGRLRTEPPTSPAGPVIDSHTFLRNVQVLGRFLAEDRP